MPPVARLVPRLPLAISRSAQPVPVLPTEDLRTQQVWRDHSGALRAYSQTIDGRYWLHVPGVASFHVTDAAERVEAIAEPAIPREQVSRAYERTVQPILLQALGQEILHGSAVLSPRGVVALCGESEAGKSTLAYALGRRGLPVWADDAVAFEVRRRRVTALPLPFRIHLRPSSAAFFGGTRDLEESSRDRQDENVAAAPLAAVCILQPLAEDADGEVAEIDIMDSSRAFREILVHAYCFGSDSRERTRRMVSRYLALVASVPCLRVRFRKRLEDLPHILERLETVLAQV